MPGILDSYNGYNYTGGNNFGGNTGRNGYSSPVMPITSQIIKVNGEAGARSLHLTPNSSILLLDENNPIVWFIQADGAGYFNPIPYDLTPHQAAPQVDLNQLGDNLNQIDNRLKRVEEMLNEQSNYRASKQTKKQQQQQSVAE